MHKLRLAKIIPLSALFLTFGASLLVGCGSTTSQGSTTTASATATACPSVTRTAGQSRVTTGFLISINGQSLLVTNQQGNGVTVTYSSTTRFTQESQVAASSLTEGTAVRVAVSSSNGTYNATTITVNTGGPGTRGGGVFGGGNGTPSTRTGTRTANNPCFNRGFATPGALGGTSTANFRGINGTVSQLSGNVLTITDATGASYTVNITSATQIVETKIVTAAALKVGQALTIIDTTQQGKRIANTIAILLALPASRPFLTPTP